MKIYIHRQCIEITKLQKLNSPSIKWQHKTVLQNQVIIYSKKELNTKKCINGVLGKWYTLGLIRCEVITQTHMANKVFLIDEFPSGCSCLLHATERKESLIKEVQQHLRIYSLKWNIHLTVTWLLNRKKATLTHCIKTLCNSYLWTKIFIQEQNRLQS